MKKYSTLVLIMILAFGIHPLFSQPEVVKKIAILDALIQEALENNPKIEAAIQRTLSAEKVISQAGALPDPQLSLGLMNLPVNSFAFNQEPMTGKLVSVMQMFPFPGKLSLATDMAEFEAATIQYQQEEIRNQVVQMVKLAYFDLYAIDRALEIVLKNMALMEQFVRVAEIKYATGSGLQHDVLRAQVELSKLEDDLIMWQQKRLARTAKLNALLNRPADMPIDKISQELSLPDDILSKLPTEKIERKRPLLRAWRERVQKVETAVKLARRDYWPNITVGASYNQRNDLNNGAQMHDFFSTSVSLNIPLYFKRKQKAKVAETELALAAVEAEYENVRSGILAEIESLRAELERNRKRVELYKGGILIQAQQSLESAHAGYQVGKVDFLTLIDNWMMLQNYELQYFFALSNFHRSLASYELEIGGEIAELE